MKLEAFESSLARSIPSSPSWSVLPALPATVRSILSLVNSLGFAAIEVRRLADDPARLLCALADQIADHGQPGGDAEPHAQIFTHRQAADRFDHRKRGAHRLLGIVLMRLRISQIDQHAVAHVFGDEAVKAADRLGDSTSASTSIVAKRRYMALKLQIL